MDRLERLINLLAALIETERPLRREEIQERVPGYPDRDESFRRQFERDKDTLRKMGVPINVELIASSQPDLGTGYRVHKHDYELPDPGLEPEEVTALHLAASSVNFLDEGARSAVRKLGGALDPGGTPPAPAEVEVPGSEHLTTCFGAIAEGRTLSFRYRDEHRTVVPGRLAFRGGHWYLSAHDLSKDAGRRFRLDRLQSPPEPGEKADGAKAAEAALPGAGWELGDSEPVEVTLWVDAGQAELAARMVGQAGRVEKHADGSVTIALQVSNVAGLRNFALGFLDHAVVLGPPEVRAEMEAWLTAIAEGAS